jgi:NADP-dependent 3-hydroxy acid dehydrogenase YdfG
MSSKTVLITGGTSGIGAHTARLLLDRGHRVAVTGRDNTKFESFLEAADRPDRLLGLIADAAGWEATRSAVARTVEHFGALHAAVAIAGFASADGRHTVGATVRERRPDAVAADGPHRRPRPRPAGQGRPAPPRGHRRAAGAHRQRRRAEERPANLYSATKWAVTGLAENLRMHATTRGVGITLVNPRMIDTPFWYGDGAPSYALPPAHVAESICFALDQPAGVDVNTVTIRPIGQPV